MSYSLVIPKDLVTEMYFIREETGISIRKQILEAIKSHVEQSGKQDLDDKRHLTFKQVDEKSSRIFNTKTGRFHDIELGIDVVF